MHRFILMERLMRRGELAEVGGVTYLVSLGDEPTDLLRIFCQAAMGKLT
jgi:hypothetical protein